ncbi:MAG: helicase, partial [Candidatus Paceibacterota bacterium]
MLKTIEYPVSLEYSSDGKFLPIEFYLSTIPHCNQIDLKLGYFSTNAIRALAYGFAQFIFNGGKLRIITNHFLSKDDRSILIEEPLTEYTTKSVIKLLTEDLDALAKVIENGDKHFFNCLRYLLKHNRLVIQPVRLTEGGMSHYKQGIFYDDESIIAFNGSCNFTYAGLIENGESFGISRSWGERAEKAK